MTVEEEIRNVFKRLGEITLDVGAQQTLAVAEAEVLGVVAKTEAQRNQKLLEFKTFLDEFYKGRRNQTVRPKFYEIFGEFLSAGSSAEESASKSQPPKTETKQP